MKKVVFVNQDSGYLMIDIVNAHVAKGYECVLITGRLVERNDKLSDKVKVEKIIAYNRSSAFRRVFTWLVSFIQIFFRVLIRYKDYELFIVSNPPIATLLPLLIERKYKLLIYDIYPDALSELGFIKKNGFIDFVWQKANKKVYHKSDRIYCLSVGMKYLLSKYAEKDNIQVIPVWTDNIFFKPIKKGENPFLYELGISSKFIVLYSGNIGLTGNVDVLIDVAYKVRDFDDILFIIIGDGPKKQEIITKTVEYKLNNVLLMDWQPIEKLPFSMSSAHIAVVSLGNKMSKLAIPSKTFNYMSVGAPLLCLADSDSELATIVRSNNCGSCFEPNDIESIMEYILALYINEDQRNTLSMNSLKASRNFDKINAELFIG